MSKSTEKILVVSIANAVTGGPEALHHLVAEMRALGMNAYIAYWPFGPNHTVPERYTEFGIPMAEVEDLPSNVLVFPEVLPVQALKMRHAKSMIWWLSVDNFHMNRRGDGWVRNLGRYFGMCLKRARPWTGVAATRRLGHLVQSHYAARFLEDKGITAHDLFEPINPSYLTHFCVNDKPRTFQQEVLYNPAKGLGFTRRLIAANPGIRFTALSGMSQHQLLETMQSAKLYIDFGHHPGRDCMPREAAMLGCCVVTSRRGSAGNPVDLPIPETYKLDTAAPGFVAAASALIRDILQNYTRHHVAFEDYRAHIRREPEVFRAQISAAFQTTT